MKNTIVYYFILLIPLVLSSQSTAKNNLKSAQEIIYQIILRTGTERLKSTVDKIIVGDPETPVKGVVSCMFATMEVLEKAVAINANLIITHEPTFYNHFDNTEPFKDDLTFETKMKYILDYELVVWRFHDYVHRIKNDGILMGMVKKLGWEEQQLEKGSLKFNFPTMSLADLLKNLKKTFPKNSFYVVGKPEMAVTSVALVPGAPGSMRQINLLQDPEIDVVVGGEVSQWETYEYVRDAVKQNQNKAIVFIGHVNSEESGMIYAAEWIQNFIKDIPVTFIPSDSSYWSY
ncbi:Nif3-like dinuclear metal center hexameric protein [Eudoraea sp.]|uniref:Nif3-like dinuclear metal center hexameric protein n=1 Tax=Eudoraea sp. TaxID=1979955 RepID=UPI003C76E55A